MVPTNKTGVCAVVFVFLSAARKTLCVLVQQGSGSVLFVCLWLCEENLSRSLTARKISHGARKISHISRSNSHGANVRSRSSHISRSNSHGANVRSRSSHGANESATTKALT